MAGILLGNYFFKIINSSKRLWSPQQKILLKNSGKSVIFKRIDSHTHYDGYYQKKIKQKISIVDDVMEKFEPLFTLGGLVK